MASTTSLSVRAANRIVEKHVATYGTVLEADVRVLLDRYGVDPDRAGDAIRLALVRGRVLRRTDDRGRAVLRRPAPIDWEAA